MIKQPPRIVIVDDQQIHLNALISSFSALGSACLPFLFVDKMPDKSVIKGTRALFFDLHLQGSLKTSDAKQYVANIASYIADAIEEDHGPYILIIWSEFPEQLDSLEGYLEELEEWQKPVFWSALPKADYIDLANGKPVEGTDLAGKIVELLSEKYGLAALLNWEATVAAAAHKTSNSIWKMCLATKHDSHTSLQQSFGRLAKGARGAEAIKKPGQALVEALIPIVSDELERADFSNHIWKDAITFSDNSKAAAMPSVNSLLHLDVSGDISPTDRGAVVSIPEKWRYAKDFKKAFGHTKSDLLRDIGYKGVTLAKEARSADWFLVQINAACDQAQAANVLIPYLLVVLTTDGKRGGKAAASIWPNSGRARKFSIDGKERCIFALGNFVISLTAEEAKTFKARYRIRENLLNLLSFHTRINSARPGIIEV